MFGDRVQFHYRSAIQKWYVRKALQLRHRRARTSVDENAVRGKFALRSILHTHAHGFGGSETGFSEDQVEICRLFQSLLAAVAKTVDDSAFALPHPLHVNSNIARMHTVVLASTRKIRHTSARHHRLRRRAPLVDTSPANVAPFDQCCPQTCLRQACAKRRAALP